MAALHNDLADGRRVKWTYANVSCLQRSCIEQAAQSVRLKEGKLACVHSGTIYDK